MADWTNGGIVEILTPKVITQLIFKGGLYSTTHVFYISIEWNWFKGIQRCIFNHEEAKKNRVGPQDDWRQLRIRRSYNWSSISQKAHENVIPYLFICKIENENAMRTYENMTTPLGLQIPTIWNWPEKSPISSIATRLSANKCWEKNYFSVKHLVFDDNNLHVR